MMLNRKISHQKMNSINNFDFPEILYEDNHILAVNKTNHDLCQGDKTNDLSLDKKLKEYLKIKYNKPGDAFIGVVHRLDRPVSGVVLYAKTSKALSRLNKMFQNGEVTKVYWAIVRNRPKKDEGTLTHYLIKNSSKNKSYAYEYKRVGAKLSILSYRLLGESDLYYLLEIIPKTGRHHQIRAQLAAINCPIKGDLKYGYPRSNKQGGISLHARSIKFIHPVSKEEIEIVAPVPRDDKLWLYFEKMVEAKDKVL